MIRRRKSLRSSSPPRRKRLTPRRSGRVRSPEYMDRVRRLPCAARHLSACEGAPEVDHVGRRPMGRKCSDFETVCFCSLHHRQRTDFSGPFAKFTGVQMREFLEWHLAETKRLLAAHADEAFPW